MTKCLLYFVKLLNCLYIYNVNCANLLFQTLLINVVAMFNLHVLQLSP